MRKLTLDVDALEVQTFETSADADSHGTVQAFDSEATTGDPGFCPYVCDTVSGPCDKVCGVDDTGDNNCSYGIC